MNIRTWLHESYLKFKSVRNSSFKLDLNILLSFVLKKKISWSISHDTFELNNNILKRLHSLLMRRICGEPISYLVGKKEFWSLSFIVSKNTLIPRPETETLVENALMRIDNNSHKKILDLGTGCGCIALALASMRLNCDVVGVDRVHESINIAKRNAKILRCKNVVFLHSFWFSKINEKYDIIVSNPPYIGLNEIKDLDNELFFEPFLALISSENGLSSIRYIIKNSKRYLKRMGWLLIEHGWMQRARVQRLFKENNYFNIITYQDYSGNDRVTVGQKR
ncbi:hypothetical protein XW81_00815 [Buchnera aphidicola (Schlechtendalia chinensis)]|uniref:Release factor glutamine methyltransferase n=1 Tax=Buchnera aphidicola subsp. Schlechtendalia chinensis TaxID=118110 RepID=A0A172WDF6_BUCSC|nr:peptide chain release factor N(5)-glutamine methyltransferase [Buchnera aphidicola]ANF16967.1 hypothetical protein XW81_00815 [Buchnera aphidicola (Schlechtendalia chinensis)]